MYNDERDSFKLNENAYFYQRISPRPLPANLINRVFVDCSSDKKGHYLYKKVKEVTTIGNYNIVFSICAFKVEKNPSFIDPPISNWIETKIAYIIIVEIEDFVVISKKSVSNITELINALNPIEYNTLVGVFVSEDTAYEQFTLQNLNISHSSMRSKSVSAIDLQENFSPLGANTYMLRGMRVSNGQDKVTLALNTSRINRFGDKQSLNEFFNWSIKIKNRIEQYQESENFTSIFAKPIDFESNASKLNPIAILFNCSDLIQKIDNNEIESASYSYLGNNRTIELIKVIDGLSEFFTIDNIGDDRIPIYKVNADNINDLFIRKNKKSITVSSSKLRRIVLNFSDGTEMSLLTYLNLNNEYIITFSDVELIYSNRKLFRDSKLLDGIDQFLKVFETYDQLNHTTSEKGILDANSVEFTDGSVFSFVEREFIDDCEYMICDDLSREWADHITLSSDEIKFYHSKSKGSLFSASDFQDVIGQAQKNFGNLLPSHSQLDKKADFWSRPYTQTKPLLSRLRKGDSIENAVEYWKEIIRSPYKYREVNIVIDFISKKTLKEKLQSLKNDEDFAEKNEVVQILWFVSSLVASSQELGINSKIICKP